VAHLDRELLWHLDAAIQIIRRASVGCSGEQPSLGHEILIILVEPVVRAFVDDLVLELLCCGLLGGVLFLLKLLNFLLGHLLQRDKDESNCVINPHQPTVSSELRCLMMPAKSAHLDCATFFESLFHSAPFFGSRRRRSSCPECCLCVCVWVWVYGCVGVWACGCVGVCGFVGEMHVQDTTTT
jgi:hypothetical protein